MPWDKFWDALFALPGVSTPIFVFVIIGLILAVRELRKSESARLVEYKECSGAATVAHEKELDAQRTTLQILDRNAVNMAARTAALDGTVGAMGELTKGFEKLAITIEAALNLQKARQEYIEKKLEEVLSILRERR